LLEPGDWLLLGTDLVKPLDALIPAYDDAAGVPAEFNRNILHVLNRELGADFDVDAFEHIALWNAQHEWIEMRLRATRAMRVCIPEVDLEVASSGARTCAPRCRRSSAAKASRPNSPSPASSRPAGGPTAAGGSRSRWRESHPVRSG
jgi:Histidine-specific methyltransferase, SAM-dependent